MNIFRKIATLFIATSSLTAPVHAANVALGQASADLVSTTVTATIQPDAADIGKPANVWIGAAYRTSVYLNNGAGWVAYTGGALPIAMKNVTLTTALPVTALDHVPNSTLSGLVGLQLYVGYGANESDMETSPGKLAKIYTVTNPSPSPLPTPTPTPTPTPASATADLAEIQAQITAFQDLYATAFPNASAVQGFFDPTFLHNGNNGSTMATNWSKAPSAGQANFPFVPGVQFTAKLTPTGAIDPGQSSIPGSVEWVGIYASYGGYSGDRDSMRFKMIKNAATGKWLIAGNQRAVKARLYSAAALRLPAATTDSGLYFQVPSKLSGANGANPQVVVTGPGLPTAGVTMARKSPDGSLVQDNGFSYVPSCASAIASGAPSCVNLLDPALTDGAVYTYTFNDAAATVYRDGLHKAPLADGSATAGMFLQIASVSPTALPSGLTAGTTATVNFTAPTSLMPYMTNVYLSTLVDALTPSTSPYIVAGYAPLPNAGSVSYFLDPAIIPASFVVKSGRVSIGAVDMYGRLFFTLQNF